MKYDITSKQRNLIKKWLGTGSINIFGPPYSGKDTQGNYLVKAFDAAPLLGGGEILRNSIIPEHVKTIMERGELVPIKDYIEIVLPYLTQPIFSGKPLILSAVGRWYGEEKGVIEVTAQSNHPLKVVVYIPLSDELIWERWETHRNLGNRGLRRDDERQSFEVRFKEFREKTLPVIDFYRDMGILITVDGNQPPKKVFEDIIDGLFELAKS